MTRQVEVLVAFAPNSAQPKVSGLYGEGRIEAESKAALMLPESSLVRAGDKAYAWRLKDKTLHKVDLGIGPRDQRTGTYEVLSGLAAGDTIMRTPSSGFKEGQKAEMVTAKVATASAAPAVQGK